MPRLQADMMTIEKEKFAKNAQKRQQSPKVAKMLPNVDKRCQEIPQVDKGQDQQMT